MAEFEYEGDLLKEINSFNEEGEITYKEKFTYKDDVMSVIYYGGDGEEIGRYSTDARGRVLELTSPFDFTVRYEPGYALPAELKSSEEKQSIIATFDEQGNYSKLTTKKGDGNPEVLNYKYIYDAQDNWTQCITYKGKKALYVTYRTYEYY